MKKTKLTRSLLAACSIVALSAVMYGCVHNGGDDAPATDMSGTPDPMPEPMEPAGPDDLEVTQTAAADAAAAAMTASDNAAASAKSATDETMYLATLQTGADSNSDAMGGREAAMAARAADAAATAAATEAAAASMAAAAATTGDAAEEAWRHAVAARDAAVAAAATADTMAQAAIEAAMTELHINLKEKTVGESSVDATTGELISPDRKVSTGLQQSVERPTVAREGQHFVQRNGPADETKYKQAVAAGSINIGKVLDTSDDAARLTLITSYQGTKTVRVFVDGPDADVEGVIIDDELLEDVTRNSIGMYYQANDRVIDGADPDSLPTTNIEMTSQDPVATAADELDAYDRVDLTKGGKPEEIFELSATGDDGDPILDTNGDPIYVRLVDETKDAAGKVTDRTYQVVDIIADESMTDSGDLLGNPDNLHPVKVSIPAATEYSHIHFGLWTNLGGMSTAQTNADLGIGFVQNHDDSGMTERQGFGTASYNGDWVAAVRRQYASNAEAGAITLWHGSATLTANFEDGEFEGNLTGLAKLEGTLSGNGFSGTKATVSHDDLDAAGKFDGEFSGGIYGPTGSEAAGVFAFDGDEAGAFRGAFGGIQ